jgi:hypothetical protein
MRTDVKLCGQYQKSVLSAKNNFNLYVTSVLFAAVFAAVSEVKLSGRSYVAASSSRIAYNVLWLGEVPPCRMLNYSTKACGGILPNHCYKPFFIRVWLNNLI